MAQAVSGVVKGKARNHYKGGEIIRAQGIRPGLGLANAKRPALPWA
jgi:hypothetical protein